MALGGLSDQFEQRSLRAGPVKQSADAYRVVLAGKVKQPLDVPIPDFDRICQLAGTARNHRGIYSVCFEIDERGGLRVRSRGGFDSVVGDLLV